MITCKPYRFLHIRWGKDCTWTHCFRRIASGMNDRSYIHRHSVGPISTTAHACNDRICPSRSRDHVAIINKCLKLLHADVWVLKSQHWDPSEVVMRRCWEYSHDEVQCASSPRKVLCTLGSGLDGCCVHWCPQETELSSGCSRARSFDAWNTALWSYGRLRTVCGLSSPSVRVPISNLRQIALTSVCTRIELHGARGSPIRTQFLQLYRRYALYPEQGSQISLCVDFHCIELCHQREPPRY